MQSLDGCDERAAICKAVRTVDVWSSKVSLFCVEHVVVEMEESVESACCLRRVGVRVKRAKLQAEDYEYRRYKRSEDEAADSSVDTLLLPLRNAKGECKESDREVRLD